LAILGRFRPILETILDAILKPESTQNRDSALNAAILALILHLQ
jgi:hypothetical protein